MNRTKLLVLPSALLVLSACGGETIDPEISTSTLVGEACAEAPDIGSQDDYECTQVIGFSQTNNWYGPNGRHFERAPGIDGDRWQLLWHSGAGVENWADPTYEGYDTSVPATKLVSPCTSRSTNPDRIVLTLSSNTLNADSSAQEWADEITAAITTIRSIYQPKRIVLQPVVGGTATLLCDTRASENHPRVTEGIELATTTRRVRGPYPLVEDCAWFSDGKGHLAPSARPAVAEAIAACYDY